MGENVKELLEELKDLSQVMLDLAYSSIFFRNKEIAQEVMMTFDRLEEIEERLYLHLFAASRGRISKKIISIIDIVESAKLVANAARNMSGLVIKGKELHPVIMQAILESKERISKVIISKNSALKGRTLGDLRLRTTIGLHVIAIRYAGKGKRWVFNPQKTVKLKSGDVVIAVGPDYSCKKFYGLASGKLKKL